MTSDAIHGCRGDTDMRRFKGTVVGIMTLATELMLRFLEESGRLGRVRAMALQAILGCRVVFPLVLHTFFQSLMTAEAEIGTRGQQQ